MSSVAIGWVFLRLAVFCAFAVGGMFNEPYVRHRASAVRVGFFLGSSTLLAFADERLHLPLCSHCLWFVTFTVPLGCGWRYSPTLEERWGFSWPFADK